MLVTIQTFLRLLAPLISRFNELSMWIKVLVPEVPDLERCQDRSGSYL